MTELTEVAKSLDSALLEQRDYLNAAASAMYRSHMALIHTLNALALRVAALEQKAEAQTIEFDATGLADAQVTALWDRLWDMSARNEVADLVDRQIADALNDLDVELDDLELSVSVDRANIHLTGKP